MSGRQAMAFEHQDQYASQRAAITSMAHSSACPERPADEEDDARASRVR
jgi:hypothetical protein